MSVAVRVNKYMHQQKCVIGSKYLMYTCSNCHIHNVIFAKLQFAADFILKRNWLEKKKKGALFFQLHWFLLNGKTELCKIREITVSVAWNTKARKGMTMATAP